MGDYVILTDSSCDLSAEIADKLNLEVVPLIVRIEDKEYYNYLDERELKLQDFYDKLREKADVKTSAVNVNGYMEAMEPILKSGKDILCLSFSSGLSNTYNAGVIAAEEMQDKYPDRKIFNVDTLSASLGQGLLVYLTAKQKEEKGISIEEAKEFAENLKMKIMHYVVVDDLHHLKRGGRISATSEIVGSVLNIKPLIHMDSAGHLVTFGKARGKKSAFNTIADTLMKKCTDLENQIVFISHSDDFEEAKRLEEVIRKKAGVSNFVINEIGPVIGAHTGPGTIAVFAIGDNRE